MAKTELGTKRICPDTGRKFYDMGKSPVISPYTGKIVPIVAPPQSRGRPEAARPAQAQEVESIVPETADAEFVSLEDADNEQKGKPKKKGEIVAEEDEIEADDEGLDDDAFIQEEEEGDDDVTDIIGDGIEKEEEQ
ncbi:TIGR02300 family protein [Undibacter mobilis]|uniref:TIGR02300 family protein n=1 Tax=Undibacter mobilis TaxID=2292256 RepID=A0A371B965_9BRAD|nr:TIGR02300 family protein [Undibacter mobilis]RDV04136.1 TIGR02300 family protein [Undibacter mobilis]